MQSFYGELAQLVERLHGMQEVSGSTPLFSTLFSSFGYMPFSVYIIYSKSIDSFYVGQTSNLADRLRRHNNSGSKATKKAKDWTLMHEELFETRSEAVSRETYIKKQKSKAFIERLIAQQ